MFVCQLSLDVAIIVNLSLLRVNEEDFPWLQTALLGNLRGVEVHYAHFACHHHHVVLRDGIACRA